MTVKKVLVALGFAITTTAAFPSVASGFRAPAHSQMTYSFTCPSGTSGHVSYTKDFDREPSSRLTIWVNGKYVHEVPHVAAELKVRNVEKVGASCEGDNTLLYLQTFDPSRGEGKELKVVYLHVNRAGEVSPSDV
ncbi:hypothetical protein ACFFGH_34265 [Lysobacter korlensis]|uniref:Uncharacterized protein n=1 Tax=Lysobacter korlensis TaxID=553636 RepID=A0ABV6S1I6_9GAMM